MNFKYGRPKSSRAGCRMCKPHKLTGEEKVKYNDPPDESNLRTARRAKKNRKKWCRGREGVPHKPEWISDKDRNLNFRTGRPQISDIDYQIYVCSNCGKKLDYRRLHVPCGQVHDGWGYGYYYKNRETGKFERKPYPCEAKAA